MNKFLAPAQLQLNFVRTRITKVKSKRYNNDVTKNGITFYPKKTDQIIEPEIAEPAKLFRVQRIKPLWGAPHWEKKILEDLGLQYSIGTDVAIVKNIPENNARLMRVKHLVRIEPIVFPYGEPTENDINNTFLKEDGVCIVTKEIAPNPERIEATEMFIKRPARLDRDTLKKDALKKWQQCY